MASSPMRYIIMSKQGFEHSDLKSAEFQRAGKPVALQARARGVGSPSMRVLDSIGENGPKLVTMTPEGELSFRLSNPDLKIVPEVFYHRQWFWPEVKHRPARSAAKRNAKTPAGKGKVKTGRKVPTAAARASAGSVITVVDRTTGKPLRGAHVVAFTDFASHTGDEGDSGANGVVRLKSISPRQALERVYLYGPPGYWGYYTTKTSAGALKTVRLRSIDLSDANLLLRQLYGRLPADAGKGVTVAVVDSGVDGSHPALTNVTGGLNCVSTEVRDNPDAAKDWGPAKKDGEHGTHVAGIIGGNGQGNGFRGVAPGVKLRSYRVFPNTGGGASNFDIAKAIDTATTDHCDIINMSLGGGPADDLTKAAIDRALAAGVLVVAAAGNDDRDPVSFPAAFPECVAVSAMGRRKSFPAESVGTSDIAKPAGGPRNKDFIADFSNFGSQIDTTGAGVEIVSTLPDAQYGSMSGTSMASPAVTGVAAYLLARHPDVVASQGAGRSQKLKDLLYASCKPEKFGRDYEGFGLPLP